MEIPTEILAAGGGSIVTVIAALWLQVRERIKALETTLTKEQAFIRETLVGLVSDATSAMNDGARSSRRHYRVVEILRKRYGDGVLQETQDALVKATHEEADTARHLRPSSAMTPEGA